MSRSRKRHAHSGRVDWPKVDATTEADVARQIADDPETAPELTEDALDRAVIVSPDGTRTPYRDRVPRPQSTGLLRPGSRAPESGVYRVVGPHGHLAGTERTVTVVRGDRLPPTPEAGQRYRPLAPSRRKASA
jgi:YjzC-like protein